VHYDNHDVIVLQVKGDKAWRLYEAPIHLVFQGERFEPGVYDPGKTTDSFTLNAGDALYIPRGQMHEAVGGSQGPSLHITVGIMAKTWTDLILEAVAGLALKDGDFRKAMPVGFARPDTDLTSLRATFNDLVGRLAGGVVFEEAFAVMRDDFVRRRRPHIAGSIVAPRPPVDAQSQLVMRPNLVWRIAKDGEELELLANGRTMKFPMEEQGALERALSGEPFVSAGLEGPLNGERALALARRLVEAVLVVPSA